MFHTRDSIYLTAPHVHLKLFGSFQIVRAESDNHTNGDPTQGNGNGSPVRLPTRKIESLLAYLVLHPEAHSREKLAALFWGDTSDEQARVSLRNALAALRKVVGAEIFTADRVTVQLNPDIPVFVDAMQFSEIGDWRLETVDSISNLQSLVSLYRGDLLADFYDDWIVPERERLRQMYLDALLQLTQHYRAASEYARAVEAAQRLLETEPANERAHQHLMFCFVALGERNAALAQYEKCVVALRQELDVAPANETTALYEWIRQSGANASLAARVTNLPIPLTSFIGREQEMAELKELLTTDTGQRATPVTRHPSLVTLTGAGGSGKTRLAIQAATDLIDAYRDGVWWVELAALTDGARVPQAVAKALGVQESAQQALTDTLENFLREKQLLLVLDNCEHLLDACAQLARALLGACPQVQILATSREPLGFIGETVRVLPTLAFPNPNALSLTDLLTPYAAVRLFADRARAVNSHFALNLENARAVAQICARLDGIPLALELAAARVYEMSVQEIAARLDNRFAFLTRGNRGALPRQQTLHALIAWSYDLLAEQERAVFSRASVFAASFTAEAAAQVCAPFQEFVADALARLVAKSLLTIEHADNETRYRMLETIREYGQAQLRAHDQENSIKARHLAFHLALAETVGRDTYGSEVEQGLTRLEKSYADVRAALQWAERKGDARAVLQFCGALREFWILRGYWHEGRQWLERALEWNRERATAPAADADLRRWYARALWSAGDMIWRQSDYAQGRTLIEQGLAIYRALGDKWQCADLLHRLGGIAYEQGDFERARRLYQEGLEIYRELDDKQGIADGLAYVAVAVFNQGDMTQAQELYAASLALERALGNARGMAFAAMGLGNIATEQKDYATAISFYEQCLTLNRALGNKRGYASVYNNLGGIYVAQGDFAAAHESLAQSLFFYHEVGSKRGITYALCNMAYLAQTEAKFDLAVELLSIGDNLLRRVNGRLDAYAQVENEARLAQLRAQLAPTRFEQAWARGQLLTEEEAFEFARQIQAR